jgi:hypothetical protein
VAAFWREILEGAVFEELQARKKSIIIPLHEIFEFRLSESFFPSRESEILTPPPESGTRPSRHLQHFGSLIDRLERWAVNPSRLNLVQSYKKWAQVDCMQFDDGGCYSGAFAANLLYYIDKVRNSTSRFAV